MHTSCKCVFAISFVFSPEQNTSVSRAPDFWFLDELKHFQEHLCIPLFPSVSPAPHSWHFRLPVQLKWHRTTTEQNHLQSLNCPQGAHRIVLRLLQPPPGNTGLLLLRGHLWASPAVLSIPCSVFICSGCVFQKPSTLTPSLTLSSIVLHIDNAGISNHAGRTQDVRQRFKCLGPFSGQLLRERPWAFSSTPHATMWRADRAHLQQETPWDFWC